MNSQDVTTFTQHRQKMRENFARVKRTGRALLVTSNGKPDAVVLSPQAYDRLASDAELARSVQVIRQSMAEFDQGKRIPASRVFAKVRRQLAGAGKP